VETNNQRPKRDILKLARYVDENFVSIYTYYVSNPLDEQEPTCFDEVKGGKEWDAAMDEEMNAFIKNGT